MIEVEAPDGSVVEFPDGTPDDVMASAMRQKFGGPEPSQPSAPQSPSINSRGPEGYSGPSYGPNNPLPGVGRSMRLGAEGAVSGLANAAGMPVDLTTAVINGLIGAGSLANRAFGGEGFSPIQNPVGGSESLKATLGGIASKAMPGYAPIAATDLEPNEKTVRSIYDYGVPAAAGGAGLANMAANRTAASAPRIGDSLLRTYAQRPGAAYTADVAAGVGSGVGADAAKTAFPDSAVAEIGGALLGGATGAASLSGPAAVKGIGNRIVNKVTGTGVPYDPKAPLMPIPENAVNSAAEILQGKATNVDAARRAMR